MREAINIGASLTTATSKQTMLEGGLVRNVYAGLANRHGLLALQLAESGFTGEHDGPGSLFRKIVSEHFDTAEVLRGIGDTWHMQQNYFKLHSCCRYNHGTLDALDAIAARMADGLSPAARAHAAAAPRRLSGLGRRERKSAPARTVFAGFAAP